MLNDIKKKISNYLLIIMNLKHSSDIGLLILRVFPGFAMFLNMKNLKQINFFDDIDI